MNVNKRIILVKRDKDFEKFLFDLLTENGYEAVKCDSATECLNNAAELKPDLIISSYNLPDIDAETFYKQACKIIPDLSFIFLSNTRDEDVITTFLKFEKCEFMVKPVVPAELLARIKILTTPDFEDCDDGKTLKIKDLKLDSETKKVTRGKKEIVLTPTEYKLLEYLMSNKDKVLSRDAILNKVWGTTSYVTDRIVDVYIGYLREKIDEDFDKKLIETVPGFGYRINGGT